MKTYTRAYKQRRHPLVSSKTHVRPVRAAIRAFDQLFVACVEWQHLLQKVYGESSGA